MITTFISSCTKELQVVFLRFKLLLKNEAEYRVSFAIEIISMIITNTMLVVSWYYFFKVYGTINGWTAIDVIGTQGLVSLIYGITMVFDGSLRLADKISNGSFDGLLLQPRSLYISSITSSIKVSTIGDWVQGSVFIGIYFYGAGGFSALTMGILAVLIVTASIIFINVSLVCSLITFYVSDSPHIAQNIFGVFMAPTLYPSTLFQGFLRFIFIFIVPSLVIGGLPIEVLKEQKYWWVAVFCIMAVLWTMLARFLMKKLVRKYESGNLIGSQ